jgi:hypothetical protein
MFLPNEEKAPGERSTREKLPEAPPMKMSEAIRIGKPLVGNEAVDFALCAIGCAWAGVHGRRMTNQDRVDARDRFPYARGAEKYALALGYPVAVCEEVSLKHSGGMPALEIADWLESKGY